MMARRRGERSLQKVLNDCQGNFLEVCEDCFKLDPQIIAEIDKSRGSHCPHCDGDKIILVYETKSTNKKDSIFYEYQTIRKRMSKHPKANRYCNQRNSCDQQACRFVHTYLEMKIWILESCRITRNTLSQHSKKKCARTKNIQYHCFHCSCNFDDYASYSTHLESQLHTHMQKIKRKYIVWKYKDFPESFDVKICAKENDHHGYLSCEFAHSNLELEEWRMRRNIVAARNCFSENTSASNYIDELIKRTQKQQLQELDAILEKKTIHIDDRTANWKFRISNNSKIEYAAFLQPVFKLKYSAAKVYTQHVEISSNTTAFDVQFENPGIYGEYSGTLVFDVGPSSPLRILNINVTVACSGIQTPQIEVLNQDWSVNRVVIEYPEEVLSEVQYENNIKELQNKYKIPKAEKLDDICLDDLTPENYAYQMHNFLYKEEAARQSVLTGLNIESELVFSNHVFLQSGDFIGSRNSKQLFAQFSSPVRLSADSDEGGLIRDSCSKVLIGMKEISAIAYECKIKMWEKNIIYIYLSERCVRELKLSSGDKRTMIVQFKLNRSIFCLRHFAIDNLGPRMNLICPLKKAYARLKQSTSEVHELDENQNSVLQGILSMKLNSRFDAQDNKSYPPLVVAGPFGTGKTHTIRNVILNILECNGTDSRILLCTHSNGAADLYIKDICHDPRWLAWKDKILRVMYHGRDSRTVLVKEVKNFCLFTNIHTFRYPTLAEVRKYKIVITTFATSPALGPLGTGLHGNAFTHIFLDEASQAMEPEVIMPISLASVTDTKIIIAGDHRQINERMFLSDKVRIPTLLERMYEAYSESLRNYRILLCNNYRCVDGILQLISELFYKKGILKKTGNVQCIPGYSSVQFIHVQGECRILDSGDFINVSEAEQILQKIEELIYHVDPTEIVVTTAYSSQVTLLRDLLRKKGYRSVTVHNARNLQALQYKVVILSSVLRRVTCLSCIGKNFGFLSDGNLLNTVLTRAKSLVIAVGDAVTLCSTGNCDKKWKTYIEHCENSQTIYPQHISLKSIKQEIQFAKLDLRATASEFIPSHLQNDTSQSSHSELQPSTELDEEYLEEENSDQSLSSYDDSYSDESEEEEDDDPILNDMLQKATGCDPNKLYVEVDSQGREMLNYDTDSDYDDNEDPNEIHMKPSKIHEKHKPIFPKHSLEELEVMLARYPEQYKRCRLHINNWFSGEALEIDEFSGLEKENSAIQINSKNNLGRTFHLDEVVVKILDPKPTRATEKKIFGQVMGVLKRHKNPKQGYYLCRPDEYNSGIMSPIDKTCTKFAIVSPKDQRKNNPNKVPVYSIKHKRRAFTSLELINYENVNWNFAYAVKYLKWAEYFPYPLGYVAKVIPIENYQKCLEYEFGISKKEKESVINQTKKIKLPEPDSEEVVDVFTIDPKGAMDLDDALSLSKCTKHKKCFILGVHITDVASLVEKGTPIDKAAKKQGGTLYGEDSVTHMLPKEMSTDKCSLLPDKVRSAISTYFHSSRPPPHLSGNVDDFNSPQKSFVKSIKQYTYEQAEKILCSSLSEQCSTHSLQNKNSLDVAMGEIWQILWSWRCTRLGGAAYYKEPRNYFELLNEGRAHILVEEAMVASNANTAKYLLSKNFQINLRVQKIPEKENWLSWKRGNEENIETSPYLSSMSEYLKKQHELQRKFTRTVDSRGQQYEQPSQISENHSDFNNGIQIYASTWKNILECREIGDLDILLFIISLADIHPSQVAALDHYRSIQNRSEWVSNPGCNSVHSSMRLLKYTKCSSPIRRYSDLVIQRCIHRALEGLYPINETGFDCDIDRKLNSYEQKSEMAKLAKSLREQPTVLTICISQITDANIKIHFSSQAKLIPNMAKHLDFGHLMLDMEAKDFIEGRSEEEIERTKSGDVLLDLLNAIWRFRFYDYAKSQGYRVSKKILQNKIDNLVVTIPRQNWQNLIDIMKNPPRWIAIDQEKIDYRKKLKNAVDQLYCESESSKYSDKMCGQTRNSPFPICHHREIRKSLVSGTAIKIQLSSWFGKNRLPEPCAQLLCVADDLDICVHHNREPLHIFAHDARTIKDHTPTTMKKYQKIWEPLVRMEAAFNSVKDGSSFILKGVKISWDIGGFTENTPQEEIESLDIGSSENHFAVSLSFCKERYIEFNSSDLLCLRLKGVPIATEKSSLTLDNCDPSYTVVVHGIITSVEERKPSTSKTRLQFSNYAVFFKICDTNMGNIQYTLQKENLWTIEVIPLSLMHRGMQSSLRKVAKSKHNLVEKICMETISPAEKIELPEGSDQILQQRKLIGFHFDLNEIQYRQKLNSAQQRFTVIQGPPGTGKSYMGAQIAATFAFINRLRDPKNPRKVLYCGPSNKSVDVAAGFLKNAGHLKVIRMYSTGLEEKIFPNPIKPKPVFSNPGDDLKQPDPKLESISLHNIIRRNGNQWAEDIKSFDSKVKDLNNRFTRKEVDQYKGLVRKAKYEELVKCDVIICTCSLSSLLSTLKEEGSMKFGQCIIDECGMCSEPETLIPLTVADPDQVVIIGDHKQLQPIIKCRKAERLGLGISLFSKYSEMAEMLTTQYRMEPDIMEFPSTQFYDGKLNCDATVLRRKRVILLPGSEKTMFGHVVGKEKIQQFKSIHGGDKSKYNLEEALAVVKLLVYLKNETSLKNSDIMVLSPYTAQCHRIKDIIKRNRSQLNDIHVGTIVTSQGSEADFVILSTVRSLPDEAIVDEPSLVWQYKHLGFVCDPHQVNVAITRAKYGMCIIGNKNLLGVNSLWKELISSYERRRAVFKFTDQF
ncbi:3'-5' exoribonuclease HELZ2-like [Styela clava]